MDESWLSYGIPYAIEQKLVQDNYLSAYAQNTYDWRLSKYNKTSAFGFNFKSLLRADVFPEPGVPFSILHSFC